jgi:ketosteroid isomerase-like protein
MVESMVKRGIRFAFAAAFMLNAGLVGAVDLQVIEDRQQIEQVWSRYAQALDTADAAAYSSLFTNDAYLEVDGQVYKGKEKIRDLIKDIRSKLEIDKLPSDEHGRKFGPIRHIVSGLIVDLRGNKATSESYWTEIITEGKQADGIGKPPSVLKMGRYDDEFVKQNGKWLFSRRVITGDLSMAKPAAFVQSPKP